MTRVIAPTMDPSMAQGGKGVVVQVAGNGLNTVPQFLDHLADDVLPSPVE